jgi:hypothetical protein
MGFIPAAGGEKIGDNREQFDSFNGFGEVHLKASHEGATAIL